MYLQNVHLYSIVSTHLYFIINIKGIHLSLFKFEKSLRNSMNTCNYKWIIDCVASTLASPRWEAEVLFYIFIFDNEEENQLQYTHIDQDLVSMKNCCVMRKIS